MTGQKCPKCNQLTFFVNGNRGECQRKANIIASGKERFYEDGKMNMDHTEITAVLLTNKTGKTLSVE